jgi:hypothetical protein
MVVGETNVRKGARHNVPLLRVCVLALVHRLTPA